MSTTPALRPTSGTISPRAALLGLAAATLLLSAVAGLARLGFDPAAAGLRDVKKALDVVTGVWLGAAMLLAMLLALRLPAVDRIFGGLAGSLRVHRATGIVTALLLAAHWKLPVLAARSAVTLGIFAAPGARTPRPVTPDAGFDFIGWLGHQAAWSGWLMIALLALSLAGGFLRQTGWVRIHRLWTLALVVGSAHAVASFPAEQFGGFGHLLSIGLLAASVLLAALECRLTARRVRGRVTAETRLSDADKALVIEVRTPAPVRPGQFVCVAVGSAEHPHPFTVVDADEPDAAGRQRITIIVRDLGPHSKAIVSTDLTGRELTVDGPYGEPAEAIEGTESGPQLWAAGGIGITPFIARMRAATAAGARLPHTTLLWSTRGAETDLAEYVREAARMSGVTLRIVDSAAGRRLGRDVRLADVLPDVAGPFARIRFCGPEGLLDALRAELPRGARILAEHFRWR